MSTDEKAMAGFAGVRKRIRVKKLSQASAKRLPKLPDQLKAEVDAARQAQAERPASPGAGVYLSGHEWFVDSPHRDLAAWEVQICEAFGTRSHGVMWTFLDQITNLCRPRARKVRGKGGGVTWAPDELELNFILATISGEKPKTALQAAMLAQMIASHLMQMRIAADILSEPTPLSNHVAADRALLFAKLTNAFANQTQAYMKLSGKAQKQTVSVSYRRDVHVHHHSHKHAHLHGGEGPENTEQPLGASSPGPEELQVIELEGSAAVLGQDAARFALSVAGHEGEIALPDTRRQKPRRAKG